MTNDDTAEVHVGPVAGLHSSDVTPSPTRVSRGGDRRDGGRRGDSQAYCAHHCRGHRAPRADGVTAPLNLIICENLKGAAAILRDLVRAELSPEDQAYMDAHIGFVDTVIARMAPPLTPELRAQDPSLMVVEPYKELPVDRNGFVGEPPEVVGMIPYAPFSFFTERKLYIHNAGHAILCYLGYQAGYEYGYEALKDDEIYFQVRGGMEESALALTRKYHPARARCSPISRIC